MLSRVVTTTGTLQPSAALQAGGSVDATAKPQLSAAALANLRADVLLRLIETMLKHMPQSAEPSPSRNLLETLLAVLKDLPSRDGENIRKLADILAKLPPELRPSVEKLISTVLSAMPTRSLVDIIRNPNGPEAQKLAILIATSLSLPDGGDFHGGGAEHPQKPLGLTLQQLAILDRQGSTVLSTLPARVLAEIVRNPNGPETQKLASLIAADLPPADDGGAETQQKPLTLPTRQLGILDRQGNLLSAIPARVLAEILRNPNGPEAQKLASLIATDLPLADDGGAETRQLGHPDRRGNLFSAIPARVLAEILRNPSGPDAQKLAVFLTSLDLDPADGLHTAGPERKAVGATNQQVAAAGRQGTQQTAQAAQMLGGDARALQVTLKRVFDLDGTSGPRTETARAVAAVAGRQEPIGANRLPAGTNAAARTEALPPMPAGRLGDQQPVEAIGTVIRRSGSADETQTAIPTVKREEMPAKAETANTAGQALARSVLHAVARDVPSALLMQAVMHLVENLSPEDANVLRILLERPLEPTVEQDLTRADIDQPEASTQQAIEAETTAEGGKAKPGATQTALSSPRQVAQGEALPTETRVAVQPTAVVDMTPDRLLPAAMPREGIPLAFVPYLPADEDLDWPENRRPEEDEAAEEGLADDGDGGDTAEQDAEADTSGDEPENADMARKREKTAEMVGVIEPGLVFYQKLGDYWT